MCGTFARSEKAFRKYVCHGKIGKCVHPYYYTFTNAIITQDDFPDYDSIVSAKHAIGKRRIEVSGNMEAQSKKAQRIYDKMDATITSLGIN